MARIIKLTESDLKKLINSIIEEKSSKKKVRPLNEGIIDTLYQIINGSDGPRNTVYRYINTCPNVKSSPTSGSNSLADRLYNAIDGAGTTESEVYEVFRALKSFEEFCSLKKSYENSYSESMWNALDGDFDMDSEWVEIMRPIRNLATTYYAKIRSNNELSRSLDGMKTTTTTRPTPKPANRPIAKPTTTTRPTPKPATTTRPISEQPMAAIANAARSATIKAGLSKQGNEIPPQLITWLKQNNIKNGKWYQDLKNPQKIVLSYLPKETFLGYAKDKAIISIYRPSTVSGKNGKWEFNGTTVMFK
jgi:hypothetical protein